MKTRFWWQLGDYDNWDEYHFMWTQWKSNRIIESLKTYKDLQEAKETADVTQSQASTHFATDKECSSSTENLINTPKRMQKTPALVRK